MQVKYFFFYISKKGRCIPAATTDYIFPTTQILTLFQCQSTAVAPVFPPLPHLYIYFLYIIELVLVLNIDENKTKRKKRKQYRYAYLEILCRDILQFYIETSIFVYCTICCYLHNVF